MYRSFTDSFDCQVSVLWSCGKISFCANFWLWVLVILPKSCGTSEAPYDNFLASHLGKMLNRVCISCCEPRSPQKRSSEQSPFHPSWPQMLFKYLDGLGRGEMHSVFCCPYLISCRLTCALRLEDLHTCVNCCDGILKWS